MIAIKLMRVSLLSWIDDCLHDGETFSTSWVSHMQSNPRSTNSQSTLFVLLTSTNSGFMLCNHSLLALHPFQDMKARSIHQMKARHKDGQICVI